MRALTRAGRMGSISDRNLRIAFITQWFPPEPTPIPFFIARSLQRRGHDVEALTGVPNYPTGIIPDGYKAWKPRSETVEGVSVRRSPLYASHDASALKRILNYVSWAASTTLFQSNRLRKADVTLVFSSPATAAFPAMVMRRLTRTPYVLFIQDLWPDSVIAAGFIGNRRVRGLVHRILSTFTNWTYQSAAHIAVLSPGMISELERRGVSSHKLSLVYNWANETQQSASPSRAEARARFDVPENAFVVSYAGNQGAAQGLDVVVRAASRLSAQSEIMFLFFGDGMERNKLEKLVADLDCNNIRFIGTIPQADMPYAQAASDVHLVSLVANALFEITMPSKVQGILAAGGPVIAVAAGDAAKVVADSGSGWAVAPGDDEELSLRILEASVLDPQALRSMGLAGLSYYHAHMSEAIGGERLDEILRGVAGSREHSRTRTRGTERRPSPSPDKKGGLR